MARSKAAQIENSQDLQWEAQLAGRDGEAQAEFRKLRDLAEARGVTYLPAREVARLPAEAILERIEESNASPAVADAVLGKANIPPVLISELFDIYAELVADQLQGKSADQVKRWAAPRKKSVRNLLEVVGDIDLRDVTRETNLKHYPHRPTAILLGRLETWSHRSAKTWLAFNQTVQRPAIARSFPISNSSIYYDQPSTRSHHLYLA